MQPTHCGRELLRGVRLLCVCACVCVCVVCVSRVCVRLLFVAAVRAHWFFFCSPISSELMVRVLGPKLRMPFYFHVLVYANVCACKVHQQQTKRLYLAWIMLPVTAGTEHNQVKLAVWWISAINTNTQAYVAYICMRLCFSFIFHLAVLNRRAHTFNNVLLNSNSKIYLTIDDAFKCCI